MAETFAAVPSKEEMLTLPLWARVALHLRAARRLEQRLRAVWPEMSPKEAATIDSALLTIEKAVRLGGIEPVAVVGAPSDINGVLSLHEWRAGWQHRDPKSIEIVERAQPLVSRIANSAMKALFASGYDQKSGKPPEAASEPPAVIGGDDAFAARLDFLELLMLAERYGWTHASGIDLDEIGPLWIGGEPDWLPVRSESAGIETTVLRSPRIAVVWDAEAVPEDDYQELVALLGELTRSCGAIGIQRLTSGECEVGVSEGVPA